MHFNPIDSKSWGQRLMPFLLTAVVALGLPTYALADCPFQVSSLTVTPGSSVAKLSWPDVQNETGYKIEWHDESSAVFDHSATRASAATATVTHTVTGLTCSQDGAPPSSQKRYTFRVVALGTGCTEWPSPEKTATMFSCCAGITTSTVKLAGWVVDNLGYGINGVQVKIYNDAAEDCLISTVTTATNTTNNKSGYFVSDVNMNSLIRLEVNGPSTCYTFPVQHIIMYDFSRLPTNPGDYPTIQADTGESILMTHIHLDYQTLLCGTPFALAPSQNLVLSVLESDPDGNNIGLAEFTIDPAVTTYTIHPQCGNTIYATISNLPEDFDNYGLLVPNITASNHTWNYYLGVPTRTVRGKLISSDGVTPLGGVLLISQGLCQAKSVTTQADGTFELPPLKWGLEFTLTTTNPLISGLSIPVMTSTAGSVVDLGTVVGHDKDFITGQVTLGGVGVAGISILRESLNEGDSCPIYATTDANGHYSIVVPVNWSGTVTCRPSGQWKAPSPPYRFFPLVNGPETQDFVVRSPSQWSDGGLTDGIPIDIESCDLNLDTSPTFPEGSKTLASAPDGSGGTFVAFYAVRSDVNSRRIYLQRLDATGNIMWDGRGLYLGAAGSTDCGQPVVVRDGTGGAIVVWTTPDPERFIRVQKVSGTGALVWPTTYEINDAVLALSTAHTLDAVTDGQGGVYIAWVSTYMSRIRTARITAYGECGWEANGYCPYREMCYPTYSACYVPGYACPEGEGVQLVSDNAQGAIIVWKDGLANKDQLYALRFDQNGAYVFWPSSADCYKIIDEPSTTSRQFRSACSDGSNGVIIMWQDIPSGALRAQKIDGAGIKPWGANGVTVSNVAYGPDIASDGSGGAYIAWRSTTNIVAQRLQANNGQPAWTPNAVVCSDPAAHKDVKLVKASDQSAIISWADARSGDWDIFAEKLSASGNPMWSSSGTGLQITDGQNAETRQQSVPDLNGGAVFIWRREDYGKEHLFAMRRATNFGPPEIQNAQAYTDSVQGTGQYFAFQYQGRASWTTNVPATTSVQYRAVDPITLQPISMGWETATTATPSTGTSHYLSFEDLVPGTIYEVHPVSETNGWVAVGPPFYVQPKTAPITISGFGLNKSVQFTEDEVPYVELTVTFNTSQSASCKVNLRKHQVNPVTFGSTEYQDSGLHPLHSHVMSQVYSPSGSLGLIGCSTQYDMVITVWPSAGYSGKNTQYPDGYNNNMATHYYVKFTTPRPDGGGGSEPEFTMGSDMQTVMKNALFPNIPNPMSASTLIRFSLEKESAVKLSIYDIQGRLVRSLADESMGPGLHQVEWDRKATGGERANAGIYFYRLVAGQFVETKKMVVFN